MKGSVKFKTLDGEERDSKKEMTEVEFEFNDLSDVRMAASECVI